MKYRKSSNVRISAGIEIGKNWLKLAVHQGSFRKENALFVRAEKIAGCSDKEISEVISRLLIGYDNAANITISIPRDHLMVRFLKLPSNDEEEISQILRLQVPKKFLYDSENMAIGHCVTAVENGFSYIFLVGINRDIIKRSIDILAGANLTPQYIAISSQLEAAAYIKARPAMSGRTFALITIDGPFLDFRIVSNGNVLFTKGIHLIEGYGSDWIGDVINEIDKSIKVYRRQGLSLFPSVVIFLGISPEFTSMKQEISRRLNIEVKIEEVGAADFCMDTKEEENLADKQRSLYSVLGAFYLDRESSIDLLPAKYKEQAGRRSYRKEIAKALFFAVSILLVVWGISFRYMRLKEEHFELLNVRVQKLAAGVGEIEWMRERLQVINDQMDMSGSSIDIIRELHIIAPAGLHITGFEYEDGQQLKLRGSSNERADIYNFSTALENSKYFKSSEVKSAVSREKRKGGEVTLFEIVCRLNL